MWQPNLTIRATSVHKNFEKMSTASYIRIAAPALLGMASLVGFGYYETIAALAPNMPFDLPGAHIARPVLGTVACLALAAPVRRPADRVVAKAMAHRGHPPDRQHPCREKGCQNVQITVGPA